jgi:ATP-dependent Clp protease protease subunit
MQHNQLLNLLASNAKRGEFRVENRGDETTIFLYDVIAGSELEAEFFGGVEPKGFIAALNAQSGKPVSIRVNSPGGHVFAAQAMAQAIRDHGAPITVYVDGVAASAATFITSAAQKVVMGSGALLMIHKAHTLAAGNADDLIQRAGLLEKVDGVIAESYSARSGKHDAEHFVTLMEAETWFNAQEAVEIGLADEVAEGNVSNSLNWNLSAYDNAPAAKVAEAPTNSRRISRKSDTAAAIVKTLPKPSRKGRI